MKQLTEPWGMITHRSKLVPDGDKMILEFRLDVTDLSDNGRLVAASRALRDACHAILDVSVMDVIDVEKAMAEIAQYNELVRVNIPVREESTTDHIASSNQ